MKINKKITVILAIVLTLSILVSCGSSGEKTTLDEIEERGTFIIGTSADYPPYEFHALIDGEDTIVGFDIMLAEYIAEEMGVELEIKDMDFKNLIGALSSGMIDAAIAGMSPDPERDINFSDIYYKATHGVLVKTDNADLIQVEEDLKGKNIGVQMGTIQEGIAEEIEDANLTVLPLINNLIMEVQTERVDGVIMEKPVAEAYAKANPELMVVEEITIEDAEGGSVVGMKKGEDALTERINEILKQVEEENLLEEWIIEANKIQEEAQILD